ncbi:MAG: BMC domain-containing protein [Firmicutes bacterium]|nr:BMC domain-containing protein [Bacillota bacterium]HOB22944.1 BMC domain-containing protein [Bacillota bacterium]
MKKAIGMLEIRSIVRGIRAADSMAKAADVELLTADSICPGKFLAVIGGSVGAVDSALAVGEAAAEGEVVDRFFLANCHEAVFPAITGSVEPPQEPSALGLVETFSVATAIRAADAAAKATPVQLLDLRLARGMGGKAMLILCGDVGAVQMAVDVAGKVASDEGLLAAADVLAAPDPALWERLL